MEPARRALLPIALSVLASFLPGCLQEGPDAAAEPMRDESGAMGDGAPIDSAPAPNWRIGDWWAIEFSFGSDGETRLDINAIVTEADEAGYVLAPDDPQIAKFQALRDYPVLGIIDAASLSATAFGGTWDWFEFPMSDGATWTGDIPNIAFDILPEGQVPIRFTATHTDEIDLGGAKMTGYHVKGTLDDGTLLVDYTYAPAIRWITSATVYDIDPDQDPVEVGMSLTSHGRNWTGTFYHNTATVLIDNVDASGFTNLPTQGGEPVFEHSPHGTFTVSADATYLFGFIFNGAVAGVRQTALIPPEGEPRRYEALGTPQQAAEVLIDEPAIAGQWRLATVGAGALTVSEVFLAEIVEVSRRL